MGQPRILNPDHCHGSRHALSGSREVQVAGVARACAGRLSSRHSGEIAGDRRHVQRIILPGTVGERPAGWWLSSAPNHAMSEVDVSGRRLSPNPGHDSRRPFPGLGPVPMLVNQRAAACSQQQSRPPYRANCRQRSSGNASTGRAAGGTQRTCRSSACPATRPRLSSKPPVVELAAPCASTAGLGIRPSTIAVIVRTVIATSTAAAGTVTPRPRSQSGCCS